MNSSELLSLFRSEMVDEVEPFLWSDENIFGYEDDAQKMFCRNTDGIADATTVAVTKIDVVPDNSWLNLHASILKIRKVTRSDTGLTVELLNQEDMDLRNMHFDSTKGPVKALITGMEGHKIRVWPISSETISLLLTVFRLPLNKITDDGDQTFEVDEEHHRHLLMWCKHLAYMKQDAETFDKSKAKDFEERFLMYCNKVREEERRKRHKSRLITYGGIY